MLTELPNLTRNIKKLDLQRINCHAPYEVRLVGDDYCFETEAGIGIALQFAAESRFYPEGAFWLGLANLNNKPSLRDEKLKATVFCVIEEFFYQNSGYLLYICDSENERQAVRGRLFKGWYSRYEHRDDYLLRDKVIKGNNNTYYLSLIMQTSNPYKDVALDYFDEIINIFQQSKP